MAVGPLRAAGKASHNCPSCYARGFRRPFIKGQPFDNQEIMDVTLAPISVEVIAEGRRALLGGLTTKKLRCTQASVR